LPAKKDFSMSNKPKVNLADIKLLVLDVDGVLTDGSIIVNSDGTETKAFDVVDGHGIKMWQRTDRKVAFLSGRFSQPTDHRAKQLDIDCCMQDCLDKLPALKKMLDILQISPQHTAYIGDDLPDLPVITYVAFGVAVANARDEVKQHADFVTTNPGGSGAVREVIEYILKEAGIWPQLLKRYLS
jgi:3-deoxy-D-manno-octulosonate 8-phosphate phosphatase (KDO 8-P phosphatase)